MTGVQTCALPIWFLGKFGTEDQPFDMEQARKDITDYRIQQAELAAA